MVMVMVVLGGACGSDDGTAAAPKGKLDVVTTTTQLTDFARVVGGRYVTVHGLLRANVDPHDFEASAVDLVHLANADVTFENGVGLEAWFQATIGNAEPKGVIVDASRGVKLRAGDPHIWQRPLNAKTMVADIANALVRTDAKHAAAYRANERRYQQQLDELDVEVAQAWSSVSSRKIVTNHDAFGYYVDRYDLDFVGSVIPSVDTQAELSAQDVDRLVANIRSLGVKAVFSESSVPGKTAETIAREAHVKVVAGDNALYGDTLGPPGSDADTYLKMIRHNTRVFVDALR
jgi:zinc/manganese transport system substrate-binding protein/manganese/iron transport system substrate-binding protein